MQLEEKLITLKKVTFFFVYHLNRKNIKRLFLLSQLSFSFAKEPLDCMAIACGCGEIGRRTRFRFWRRKAWGFKSLHPHHYFLSNSLKFLQEIHLEDKSCHTFSTQSAHQASIIITDVSQNTQSQHLDLAGYDR